MIFLILSILLLFTGCGSDTPQDTTAAETTAVVSETENVSVTPTPLPTATPSPTPTAVPTPTEVPEQEDEEEHFEVTDIEPAETMYTTDSLKIRKGPSKDYDVLAILAAGDAVEVNGRDKDGWYRIKYDDGPAFVSDDYLSAEAPTPTPTEAPLPEAVPDPLTAEVVPVPEPVATATPIPTLPPVTPVKAAGVLMIGDSRCVMMQAATGGGGAGWICENGKGYDWMMSTAFPSADAIVGKGTKVVICLGVNDTNHAASYATAINAKAAEWAQRGAKTYFVSVNPVWENPYTTEDKVIAFNATMAASLIGVKYVNTHDTLATTGYTMIDGLHYNDETSKVIYNLIIGSLR